MGMNGHKGRAKELGRIKRDRLREAAAAGIDTTDRAAVAAFHDAKWNEMVDRVFASKSPEDRASMKR